MDLNFKQSKVSINEALKKSEKNLSVAYTTILESHLEFSTILKNSDEQDMTTQFEFMNIRKRNSNQNYSANHLPLPVIQPPTTSHGFTEMWFDILRKRREEIPKLVNDSN